jgi:hypothetical protein
VIDKSLYVQDNSRKKSTERASRSRERKELIRESRDYHNDSLVSVQENPEILSVLPESQP